MILTRQEKEKLALELLNDHVPIPIAVGTLVVIQINAASNISGHVDSVRGKTPLDACGIKIEGENKWLTMLQNASNVSKIPA